MHMQDSEGNISHILWADDISLIAMAKSQLQTLMADTRRAAEATKPPTLDLARSRSGHSRRPQTTRSVQHSGTVRIIDEADIFGVRVRSDRRAPGRMRGAAAWRAFSACGGIFCARSRPWRVSWRLWAERVLPVLGWGAWGWSRIPGGRLSCCPTCQRHEGLAKAGSRVFPTKPPRPSFSPLGGYPWRSCWLRPGDSGHNGGNRREDSLIWRLLA